ncbi:MAG TPA: hypothetical protein VK498_12220 [Ferruginibacter sp.]|nr:hypothetical protein [Ferruginibacter sp.]
MKTSHQLLSFFIVVCLIYSCKTKNQQNKASIVSLVCLKENDTLNIRITNHTGKTIHIPKEYDACYTLNSDTLHLETIGKVEFNTDYYYLYKNIFPFEFYTTKKIADHVPDSIEKHVKQTFFYNQFRVQAILPLLPDSSYIIRLQFNVPKYANTVKAVYYYNTFLDKSRLDKVDYFLEDFVKFDSLNANYIIAPIFVRYR